MKGTRIMENNPSWLFDETIHVGVDYSDKELAQDYDNQHKEFRNFQQEAQRIAESIGLTQESNVLDIGCGTGGLSTHLASICKHVYAVDVSEAMIEVLQGKISQQGLKNVTPVCSGFLTYEHQGEGLDAIFSSISLHHLPDFWKQIVLCRFHDLLQPGGKLFIADVIFSFSPKDYQTSIDDWLNSMRAIAGPKIVDETIIHIREEYSTWDWIMQGMLERVGFSIDSKDDSMQNMCAYICTK